MTEMMGNKVKELREKEQQNNKFKKSLWGYNTKEVDLASKDIIEETERLKIECQELRNIKDSFCNDVEELKASLLMEKQKVEILTEEKLNLEKYVEKQNKRLSEVSGEIMEQQRKEMTQKIEELVRERNDLSAKFLVANKINEQISIQLEEKIREKKELSAKLKENMKKTTLIYDGLSKGVSEVIGLSNHSLMLLEQKFANTIEEVRGLAKEKEEILKNINLKIQEILE